MIAGGSGMCVAPTFTPISNCNKMLSSTPMYQVLQHALEEKGNTEAAAAVTVPGTWRKLPKVRVLSLSTRVAA